MVHREKQQAQYKRGEKRRKRLVFVQGATATRAEQREQHVCIKGSGQCSTGMWACLSLLATLCLLQGGEAKNDGDLCQMAPSWGIGDVEPMKGTMAQVTVVVLFHAGVAFCLVQASRMEDLLQSLENQGLKDVVYMVVNHQGQEAQQLHAVLRQRLSANVTLYEQSDQQTDVWWTLSGEEHDFLIYDRCGRLTEHLSLPYSTIGQGFVERAIKDAYCNRTCGHCAHESAETQQECAASTQLNADAPQAAQEQAGRNHPHGPDQQGFRPQWHEQGGKVVHSQHKFELGQRQEAGYIHQIQQDAAGPCERETDTCKVMLTCQTEGIPGTTKCCCTCPTLFADGNREHEPCQCYGENRLCDCHELPNKRETCQCQKHPECHPPSRSR
ncbi:selenoprotein Pa [Pseudoliparis swirei]|uniref:selenoprotein Pa n=1 Tax=Pseudoliparis swirei TaxID=2059687 RepID=UPI0024BE6D29|nr:selenoprotein Pa [Pseudoliparis swirei]